MDILTIDYKSPEAPQQFTKSLKETGFAVLHNHGIPASLFQRVKNEWTPFFASEEKFKFLYDRSACPQDGYIPTESAKGNTLNDLKEFYHVYLHGRLPEYTRESTQTLFKGLYSIGIHLLEWLQENTPTEIKSQFSCPLPEMADPFEQTLLRIIHSPPLKGDEPVGAIRAAEHEDINLITILPASDEPGLQTKDMHGNWHTVPCDPGMIVVNAGDPLQLCSNFYYKSTTHRVCNPDTNRKHLPRYSFPLFLHAKSDVVLDTKTGFTSREYLLQRLKELGLQ